jgi:integrase
VKPKSDTYNILKHLLGRRIEEAIGLKPTDLDDTNILTIRRIIYDGKAEELETPQVLPLDGADHRELVHRLRTLGQGKKWIFESNQGTPINPNNVRRRFLHPAAVAVGVRIGGWHDFRQTLVRMMRKAGVHPVVISGVVGHKSVELAPQVYDRADRDDIRQGLSVMSKALLPNLLPRGRRNSQVIDNGGPGRI